VILILSLRQKIILSGILVLAIFAVVTNSAGAVSGTGYFKGGTSCTTNASFSACAATPSTSENDVISGRTASNGVYVVPSSARTNRAAFRDWVINIYDNDTGRDKQGAAFIMNTVVGAGKPGNPAIDSSPTAGSAVRNEFISRLANPNITMSVVNADPNNYGDGRVSFSGKSSVSGRDTFFTTYPSSSRPLILFRTPTGTVVYVLEIPCANPVGDLNGLPNSSVTITPNATVSGGGFPASAAITVPVNTPVSFSNTVTTSNTAATYTDSFDWALTSTGVNALSVGTPTSGTNVQLDPNRLAVNAVLAFTPTSPGTYCRRITVSGYPSSYTSLPVGAFDQACVTAVAAGVPTLTPGVNGAPTISRGSSAVFTLQQIIATFAAPNKTYTYDVNYSFDGVTYAPITAAISPTYAPRGISRTVIANGTTVFPQNIAFTPAQLATTSRVCIELRIVANGGMNVTGNPARLCTDIDTAGSYTVVANGTDHEKGDGTARRVTYSLIVAASVCTGNETVVWGGDGSPDVTSTIPCGTAATYTTGLVGAVVTQPAVSIPAATLNAQNPGDYGAYYGAIKTIDGVVVNRTSATPAAINVYEIPYFRAYGNDISAAGCEDVPDAALRGSIIGSTKSGIIPLVTGGAGNKYAGAAAEYAAIALSGKPNTVLTGVFQNYAGSAPIRLQAFWGSNAVCPDTVYGKVIGTNLPGIVDDTVTAGAYTLTSIGAGNNRYISASGNTAITGIANASGKQTIFVNGDARITSNIITPVSGSFDNKTAPVILIIASGNIYIDPGVSQVDAILVAQSDIYTCSKSGDYGQHAQGTVHETPALGGCRNKLIINGALNASNVHFQRSIGTRLLAPDNETSNRVPTPPGSTDTAAESVNYPYYLYFTTPYLADKAKSTFQSYFTPTPFF
jgi:hypothetical protein